MSLAATIRAIQKKLGVSVDGKPGPESWGVPSTSLSSGRKQLRFEAGAWISIFNPTGCGRKA
jgi:hypothetical protein